jgi:hypothetical protein
VGGLDADLAAGSAEVLDGALGWVCAVEVDADTLEHRRDPAEGAVSDEHLWIGRCTNGPRKTWAYDPSTSEAVGELDAVLVTNSPRTFALTIERGTRNTLVHAVNPDDLSLSAPVAWPGIPGFVRIGTDMAWIASETQLLGYSLESLPNP